MQKKLINQYKIRYLTLLKSEIRNPQSEIERIRNPKSQIVRIRNPQSKISNFKRWLRTRRRTFLGNLVTLYRLRSIHDTDRITYRCFLPDLTRFMTVCCVVSNQNGPRVPCIRSLGGNSAPHKRISGKGHR